MFHRIQKALIGVAAIGALALGGSAIAGAASTTSTTTPSTSTTQAAPGPAHGRHPCNWSGQNPWHGACCPWLIG